MRVPCRVQIGDSSHFGVVLNLSRNGLFVQTSAGVLAGDPVELTLHGEVPVRAQVVWHRRVPPALRSVAQGGAGLRIVGAPEEYYWMLAKAAGVQL
jgi:hypothetical protein